MNTTCLTDLQTSRDRLEKYAIGWSDRYMQAGPVDHHLVETAIGNMYRSIGLKPPRVVWCNDPLTALALRTFFASLSLTLTRRQRLRRELARPFLERIVLPVLQWMVYVGYHAFEEDDDGWSIGSMHPCPVMMTEAPDFLNVWLTLPEKTRQAVRAGLTVSLVSLGLDRSLRYVGELEEFLEGVTPASINEMRQREWDQTDDREPSGDDISALERGWWDLKMELRSRLRPGRWAALWKVMQKRETRTFGTIGRNLSRHPLRMRSDAETFRKDVERYLEEDAPSIVRARIYQRLLHPELRVLESDNPALPEVRDSSDSTNFAQMYTAGPLLAFLSSETGMDLHPFHEALNTVLESAGWFFPHRNICWVTERPVSSSGV